jgi:hypothetical protein
LTARSSASAEERLRAARNDAETTARRIANQFGAPWVTDLSTITRPLYALSCQVFDLEEAMIAAISLIGVGKSDEAISVLEKALDKL